MSDCSEAPPPTVRIQRGNPSVIDGRPVSMGRSRSQSVNERSKNQERHSRPRGATIVGAGKEEFSERSSWANFGLQKILPWSKSEDYNIEQGSKAPATSESVQLGPLSDSYARSVSSPSNLNRVQSSQSDPQEQADTPQRRGSRVLLLDAREDREGVLPPPIVVDMADDDTQSDRASAPAGPSREAYDPSNPSELGFRQQNRSESQQRASTMARLGNMIPLHRLGSLWAGSSSDDGEASRVPTRCAEEAEDEWGDDGEKPTVRVLESQSQSSRNTQTSPNLHSDTMVDYLDVLDPAVSLFNTLQDYGNSAMLPNLPWLYNRRPMLRVEQLYDESEESMASPDSPETPSPLLTANDSVQPSIKKLPSLTVASIDEEMPQHSPMDSVLRLSSDAQKSSEDSVGDQEYDGEARPCKVDDDQDPHTERWYQMDEDERKELEGHIRHLLTNKSKTKRMARGFWNFVRTPMGFILTLYIFLIFSWGVVIFLFIVHWVHVEPYTKWRIWVEVCDQVLCALFVLRGVGFAPFRAVDTYRMAHIAHFHFLTYKRRKLLHLPRLQNENELPRYSKERVYRLAGQSCPQSPEEEGPKELDDPSRDLEAIGVRNTDHIRSKGYHLDDLLQPIPGQPGVHPQTREQVQLQRLERAPSIKSMVEKDTPEVSVLTPSEQALLQHHQRKFHASHTFYRYRETSTHQPFPLWLMMTIVILLDIYSCLQACLAGTTWGIRYEHRPTALTATIISSSLSCNAIAGILIWQGGKHTRKTEVVKQRVKLALEQRAIERMERKRKRRAEMEASQLAACESLRAHEGS